MSAEDFKIEVDKLDQEWMMLPRIYSEYCEQVELMDTRLRKLKARFDIRKAEISREIRQSSKEYCKEYHVTSITESFISTLLDCDEELQKMQFRILDCERDKRLLASAVKSLEMKRDGLKDLIRLYQSEYFSIIGQNSTRKMEVYKRIQESFENRNVRREMKKKLRENTKSKTGEQE